MTKKIYPGNYVNQLSAYQAQGLICMPGRSYVHKVGYIKVDSTPRTEFNVIIPSPDKRSDDKPRADITGLVVPNGACVYYLALRILDARKDAGVGTDRKSVV